MMTPYKYITTMTRIELEADTTAWLASIMYPAGQLVKGMLGEGDSTSRSSHSPETVGADDGSEGYRRERRASRRYSWHRGVSDRKYNVYNLDARSQGEYQHAINKMKKDFASQ